MPIIWNDEVKFAPGFVENISRRVMVSPEKGSGAITMGESIMSPGTELWMHTHRIEEAIVITKGEATVTLGDETHILKKGDVILAPAGVKHSIVNQSSELVEFMFFYPSVEVKLERV